MNNFFGDLIGRHKEQGSIGYAKPMVEPRLKTRYESESAVPNETLADQPSAVAVNTGAVHTSIEKVSLNPEPTLPLLNQESGLSPQPNTLDITADKATSRHEQTHARSLPEPIENATALPPTGVFLHRLPISERHNTAVQQPDSPLITSRMDDHESSRNPLVTDELGQRAQAILQRLSAPEKPLQRADGDFSFDKTAMLSARLDNSNLPGSEPNDHSSHETFAESSFAESSLSLQGNHHLQNQPSVATPPQTNLEGVLNIPHWLADMQAEINQRQQHINANAKVAATKPVVNVTIGRVEVRAVQDSGLQASKSQQQAQKKPSGVMSLDDYLKSRDKESRA